MGWGIASSTSGCLQLVWTVQGGQTGNHRQCLPGAGLVRCSMDSVCGVTSDSDSTAHIVYRSPMHSRGPSTATSFTMKPVGLYLQASECAQEIRGCRAYPEIAAIDLIVSCLEE